eukprot:TRINITY_DN1513_c3_g1_i1.p1 TRINITY_DN1513_c3_g1~~TRINITY_DN1513_c3_g1_i1.p1  ORF type:complete len:134 (+),score=38.53 TRINITY_DN1513_c3_g1_i1:63-464(+)
MSDNKLSEDDSKLKTITEAELAAHSDVKTNLWLAIGGRVYDVNEYKDQHPGGIEALEQLRGKDATDGFKHVGHGSGAKAEMKKLCIGKLEGATLLTDEELSPSGGEGSKWLIFAILAVVLAYFYMKKMANETA